MYYCMRIKFFPTGLSLSDVIFFLMVIASFLLFLVFFLLCWYSISVITSYLVMKIILLIFKKKSKISGSRLYTFKGTYRMARVLKMYDLLLVYIIVSLIGVFIILSEIKKGNIETKSVVLSLFAITVFIALIPNVYFDKKVGKENKKKVALSIGAFTLLLFFTLSDMPPLLSDAGMNLIGVRKSNITVTLQGNDLEMARYLTGNRNQTYFKGDAIFTGVGTTSLLIINQKRMIVSNENMSITF